jgi:hypothetical protein
MTRLKALEQAVRRRRNTVEASIAQRFTEEEEEARS